MPQTFGINVIGYVSSNVSLGITARHFIRLLLEKGVPVAVFDVEFESAVNARDRSYDDLVVMKGEDLPHPVNLFFLSSAQMVSFLRNPPKGVLRCDRLNAGVIWYELTQMPSVLREGLALLDVLVAGSPFVRQILATNVSGVLTIECRHPIFLPSGIQADRGRFGLPNDRFLFVSSFDPHHDPYRKNPFGAIDAFLKAFDQHQEEAGLVVKLNNTEIKTRDCDPQALIMQLEKRCMGRTDIWFISQSLAYTDVLSLYASCDVFVSLHRSEGLGMGPLECMLLGKPVIATAWSGNLAYMDHTNACLVGADLVPYRGYGWDETERRKQAIRWAEPRIPEASDWMRKLHIDSGFRRTVEANAYESASAYHDSAKSARFIEEIRNVMAERTFLSGRPEPKWAQLGALKSAYRAKRYSGLSGLRRRVLDEWTRHVIWRFRRK